MILGIDPADGVILGLDANLWDPLPMGISLYTWDAEIEQAKASGWHVWRRSTGLARSARTTFPTSLETVVAFTRTG